MTDIELIAMRRRVREELRSLQASPLSPPSGDAWTPRQVLQHILQAEHNAIVLLEKLVTKAGPLPSSAPAGPLPIRDELLGFDLERAMSIPAARGTEPEGEIDDDALGALETSVQARFHALLDLGKAHDLGGISFPHPLAGRLNFYEWLVFGVVHEELHLRLLRRNVESGALGRASKEP